MPAQLLHPIDEIIGKVLWANRGLGSDPAPWLAYTSASVEKRAAGDRPTTQWPVFVASEPTDPDNVVTVYETTPLQWGKIMVSGQTQQHYGFTIRVRGKSRTAARRKASDIEYDFFNAFRDQEVTLDGQRYLVPSVPSCVVIPLPRATSPLWLFNLNCLAPILAYPIGG